MTMLPENDPNRKVPCAQNACGNRPPDTEVPACAPGDEQPESKRVFSMLVNARLRGWLILTDLDFEKHIAHAFLEAATGGYTCHLAYGHERRDVQVQVRLDLKHALSAQMALKLARFNWGTPMIKVIPDSELRAVFIIAASVLPNAETAKMVLSRLVKDVRATLSDTDLMACLELL